MKIKTSELTGAALDWAVAKCEGASEEWESDKPFLWHGSACIRDSGHDVRYSPSTNWSHGGQIIEDYRIQVNPHCTMWHALKVHSERGLVVSQYGSTALIAAMRCYVASKLGDEIDIPDRL